MQLKLTLPRIVVLIIAVVATFFIVKAEYRKALKDATAKARDKAGEPALEGIVSKLKIYTAYDKNGPIKLIRHGNVNDGGYVVPEIALEQSDVLMGYGIADDIAFEERFSDIYNKPSYGFDCGTENIEIKNKLCSFIKECIGSDSFVNADQKSSGKISSFSDQIQKLGLKNKKIFIKMDIEGAEYEAFEDILKYAPNITGIAMELHFVNLDQMIKASNLLSRLNENFLLLHVHANNCETSRFFTKYSNGGITKAIELTFINKALADKYHSAADQSHPTSLDIPNCPKKDEVKFEILAN